MPRTRHCSAMCWTNPPSSGARKLNPSAYSPGRSTIFPFERLHQLLQRPSPPERAAAAVIDIAFDDRLAILFGGVVEHEGRDPGLGRPQAVGHRIVADMQPLAAGQGEPVPNQRVALARGLGEKGIGRGDYRLDLMKKTGMVDQDSEMGRRQVDVGQDEDPLARGGQIPQPVDHLATGHEHAVLHHQLVVRHFRQQGAPLVGAEDLHQGFEHELRVAGLVIDEILRRFQTMLLFDVVAELLDLLPRPGLPGLNGFGGDEPGHRQLDQIGIMDPAHQQGVEEIEGDDIDAGRQFPPALDQRLDGIEFLEAHCDPACNVGSSTALMPASCAARSSGSAPVAGRPAAPPARRSAAARPAPPAVPARVQRADRPRPRHSPAAPPG